MAVSKVLQGAQKAGAPVKSGAAVKTGAAAKPAAKPSASFASIYNNLLEPAIDLHNFNTEIEKPKPSSLIEAAMWNQLFPPISNPKAPLPTPAQIAKIKEAKRSA